MIITRLLDWSIVSIMVFSLFLLRSCQSPPVDIVRLRVRLQRHEVRNKTLNETVLGLRAPGPNFRLAVNKSTVRRAYLKKKLEPVDFKLS